MAAVGIFDDAVEGAVDGVTLGEDGIVDEGRPHISGDECGGSGGTGKGIEGRAP